jgi:hypothetical protein
MLGNEEIDALLVIGIPVNDYLILPRLLALTVMMPLLYLYGCAVGTFGGFVVSVAMLNLSPGGFIDEISSAVAGKQVAFGLVRSVAFGALIAIVGYRAGRSAADVGQAATKPVVAGIVGVIALDAVFAICANALNFWRFATLRPVRARSGISVVTWNGIQASSCSDTLPNDATANKAHERYLRISCRFWSQSTPAIRVWCGQVLTNSRIIKAMRRNPFLGTRSPQKSPGVQEY